MLKVQKTLSCYSKKIHYRCRDIIFPIVNPHFKRPVFVIGCSRSGTTAVYNVLGMASGIASMHKESHDFWNYLHPLSKNNWESHMLDASNINGKDKKEVSRFYYRYLGENRFIDKANQNCFRIPFLHALFPDAFFVYIKRDGRDNINSLIYGWGRPDEYGSWSREIPATVEIENGRYNRWCFFLFPCWQDYLKSSIEEVCARQWIEANRAVLDAKKHIPSGQWVELFYEDILKSAAETFSEVYKKLDLSYSDGTRKHCESLVSHPYNAFSTPRLNKWEQENPERIKRILPLIKPMMLDMGYEV